MKQPDTRAANRNALLGALLALLSVLAWPRELPAQRVVEVTDANVAAAVKKAAEYLWSQQNEEGHWDKTRDDLKAIYEQRVQAVKEKFRSQGAAEVKKQLDYLKDHFLDSFNRDITGVTSLALLGLLHAGADPNDKRFRRALAWEAEQNPTGTYALGLRATLWSLLDRKYFYKLLRKDALTLMNGVYVFGSYSYTMSTRKPSDANFREPAGDFSNTQYGILGVWAGSEGGVEIHPKYWKVIEHGYVASQNKDGGWPYPVNRNQTAYKGESRLALSLGGIASLFLVWDKYYAQGHCDAKVDDDLVKAIKAGIDWAGQNMKQLTKAHRGELYVNSYTLYALERAGVACGLKYFGGVDWYKAGAAYALRSQAAAGAWGGHGNICGTAWAVMFLQFGRAPVVFNKLAYGKVADWNARPRDLANLTKSMGKVFEGKFNWQIMPIDATPHDLQDAPILFISGKRALAFDAEEKAKLKNYVLQGGTLLFSPAGVSGVFTQSVYRLIRELFPEHELVPVPPDAPIYQGDGLRKVSRPVPFHGLNNGIRWTVLVSSVDLGCPWQQMKLAQYRDLFAIAYNLYLYISDNGNLRARGESYMVADKGNKPATTLTVGRAAWASVAQSDPEPAAWKFQDVRLRNANVMSLDIRDVELAQPIDAAAINLLHVTGVSALTLNDKAKANLKAYIEAGGLVLADAAGGSAKFAESFPKVMVELFGNAAMVPAPPNLPFIAQATEGGKIWYRHRDGLPKAKRTFEVQVLRLENGRIGAVFLPFDLSSAMVGYPSMAPSGLMPEAADTFVTALLKWRVADAGNVAAR